MAWYYGKYTCGHEGRVNIIGKVKDREWKKEKSFNKLCPKCQEEAFKENVKVNNLKAKEETLERNLIDLKGTEKQVEWGITLRVGLIKNFEEMFNELEECSESDLKGVREKGQEIIENCFGRKDVDSGKATLENLYKIYDYIIDNISQAKFFIDYRDSSISSICKEVRKLVFLSEEEEQSIKDEINRFNNSILSPENITHEGLVSLDYKDNLIKISYDKISNHLKELLREFNITWEYKHSAFTRYITNCNGHISDRLAEVGIKLLEDGYQISVIDEEVLKKIKTNNYEPECKRWILVYNDNLAIKWFEYNKSLYNEARAICKGTKWDYDNKYVIVPVTNYREVEKFSNDYGFKYSEEAIKLIENTKINE
ncbi:hypothetical protein BFS06_14300 [Clostridium perfringens]|uniref:hypothetical protein n=1 Tax=Clostridium perfringens TaxID=1502 RepID=UPI00103DF58B|nr:hypothetical protein [Clostridium perfringens]TBX14377.1 hypothetical protein BFS06_14300 [Clostridium perfringens]